MNILLINTNPVVSGLLSLCVRKKSMHFEEVQDAGDVSQKRYDVLFVDEASCGERTAKVLETLSVRESILLSGGDIPERGSASFDTVIKKPFLPSQITVVLESLEREGETDPDLLLLNNKEAGRGVLDGSEIEKIKALLEMDEVSETISSDEVDEVHKAEVIRQHLIDEGLEIVEEEAYVVALSGKPPKKKCQKSKVSKQSSKKDKKARTPEDDIFGFEEVLLAAIKGMKVKKIKKLLKGAEVTIKINFNKDET